MDYLRVVRVKIDHNELVMKDGTRYYAFSGCLGIDDRMSITYGYDGWVGEFDKSFPRAHKLEIADFMIALWTKYREEHAT